MNGLNDLDLMFLGQFCREQCCETMQTHSMAVSTAPGLPQARFNSFQPLATMLPNWSQFYRDSPSMPAPIFRMKALASRMPFWSRPGRCLGREWLSSATRGRQHGPGAGVQGPDLELLRGPGEGHQDQQLSLLATSIRCAVAQVSHTLSTGRER
jgi:hypothetical protein